MPSVPSQGREHRSASLGGACVLQESQEDAAGSRGHLGTVQWYGLDLKSVCDFSQSAFGNL